MFLYLTSSGRHFVDLHRAALIGKVSDTGAILDELLDKGLISEERFDAVRALDTTQARMREIIKSVSTNAAKDALYEILNGMRALMPLMSELEGSQ